MTVAKLRQYRSLKCEINELKEKIEECTVHDVVKASSKEFPYVSQSIKIGGLAPSDKRAKMYITEQNRLLAEVIHIESWINDIEDSELRRIFRFRYLEGERPCSWKCVARMLGVYGDGSTERKKHDRYMENMI